MAWHVPVSYTHLDVYKRQDLDGLKRINDSQGHTAGDRYLIQFSRYVIRHLREEDVIARIGGDEFVILLLDCDKTDACDKLEKMRSEITGEEFEHVPVSYTHLVEKREI